MATTDKPTFLTSDREVELRRALWASFEGKESSKERTEARTDFCRRHKLYTWEGEGMFVNGYSYGYEDGFRAAMAAAYRVINNMRFGSTKPGGEE